MKVNLRKVKPLKFEHSNITVSVFDPGKGYLRHIELDKRFGQIFFYHEDALELRDWLSKALGDK